jgi:excinuclease ABC subunit B
VQFQLSSSYQSTGDQPGAIRQLTERIREGDPHNVLLGVTGSGKTFTVANVIAAVQKPTLVIAHNKTLAAQLYQEFRDFFLNNAVSYFVSYYDYYQPEAYVPSTDTYIEKEATINDEIDKLRLATTTNLLTRPDVIVVASVSCIYNLGSPVEYGRYLLRMVAGEVIARETILLQLANLQYERSENDLRRGTYRLRGDTIQLWPAYQDTALRIETLEDRITAIHPIDPISGTILAEHNPGNLIGNRGEVIIYPAKHYVVDPKSQQAAIGEIRADLQAQLQQLRSASRIVEAYRLEQKVNYDLEMIQEFGFVNGIENYSRYFDGRAEGSPPFTLLDYMAANAQQFNTGPFLTVIDESHMTVPQVRGMYAGDQSRKRTLIEYGFRLPSALDNRPLKFEEFTNRIGQALYVSATPNEWEITLSGGREKVVEQLIRPTGLIDPVIELRPIENQIEDLIIEVIRRKQVGQRCLVTTLTKKMAEALTEYLNDPDKIARLVRSFVERGLATEREVTQIGSESELPFLRQDVDFGVPIDDLDLGPIPRQLFTSAQKLSQAFSGEADAFPKVAYLHSDIETLERSDILDDLRSGVYDVVVGINLLREGLDLPEVTLVAILDADKEGFLRSRTALIQTMGRAARHQDGRVLLYADKLTGSMRDAINETQRRRAAQIEYNQKHDIIPTTIAKPIRAKMIREEDRKRNDPLQKRSDAPESGGMIISLNKHEQINLTEINPSSLTPADAKRLSAKLRRRMNQAARDMDFELAAVIRDVLATL